MTKKSCTATVGKLCEKAELSKEECREITKKLCPRELPSLPSLPSIEEREEEEEETERETEKEERRELTKRPHPLVLERVVPEFPKFPRMRTLPHMPTLAEGLKEPKKKKWREEE